MTGAVSKEAGGFVPSSSIEESRSPFRRLLDFVFGYDFFISYAWRDGALYAEQLARRLEQNGFDVFLDRDDYALGDDWQRVGGWTLRRTGQLILIGSPLALESGPVARELDMFGKTGRRIVPIDFGGSLEALDDANPISRHLPSQLLRIRESVEALKSGPSDDTLAMIRRTFNIVRQDKKRVRFLSIATTVLAAAAIAALIFGVRASISDARAQDATRAQEGATRTAQDALRAERVATALAEQRGRQAAESAAKERAARLREAAARSAEEQQRRRAEERQRYAERQRNAAVAAREAERTARIRADQSAREAFAQADAATAYAFSDRDPTLALRLAARSASNLPNTAADLALLRAYDSGSWFYSHRLPDAWDAALSPDERTIAWLDGENLHLLDLASGEDRPLPDRGSDVLIARNGNIATWDEWWDGDGTFNLRRSDGTLLTPHQLGRPNFVECGGDYLVATSQPENPEGGRLRITRFNLVDGVVRQEDIADAQSAFDDTRACSANGELAVLAGNDSVSIIRFGGAQEVVPAPGAKSSSGMAISPNGDLLVLFTGGPDEGGSALTVVRLGRRAIRMEPIRLTEPGAPGSAAHVYFLASGRVLVAASSGWIRIVDLATRQVTLLSDRGRAVDAFAVAPQNGEFAMARRSGSVSLYDSRGTRTGSLLGPIHSDALNPAFQRIAFGTSGNVILTVSRTYDRPRVGGASYTDGVRLWHRPRLPVIVTRPQGENDGQEPLPQEWLQAVAARQSPVGGVARTCSDTEQALRDDSNYLFLCIRIGGRMDFIPSGLRLDEFSQSYWPLGEPGGPIHRWVGERMQRLFVLDPRLILEEVRANPDIWRASDEQLDHIFERRPGGQESTSTGSIPRGQ